MRVYYEPRHQVCPGDPGGTEHRAHRCALPDVQLVPRVAVEESHAARGTGLPAQRDALRQRVVQLHQVLRRRPDRALEAEIELVVALAERDHVAFELARAAQAELVQAEARREALAERR